MVSGIFSLLPSSCACFEERLRHHRSHHQVRDVPFFSVHWRNRKPEGTAFSVLLPLSMHHYLAAEAVSGSLWLGRLPGEHMGTDAAVRSGSTKRDWQDGRPSWMRPRGRLPLRGCVSLSRRLEPLQTASEPPHSGHGRAARIRRADPRDLGLWLGSGAGEGAGRSSTIPCAALLTCFARRGCP